MVKFKSDSSSFAFEKKFSFKVDIGHKPQICMWHVLRNSNITQKINSTKNQTYIFIQSSGREDNIDVFLFYMYNTII